jgi:hypothetical protein
MAASAANVAVNAMASGKQMSRHLFIETPLHAPMTTMGSSQILLIGLPEFGSAGGSAEPGAWAAP